VGPAPRDAVTSPTTGRIRRHRRHVRDNFDRYAIRLNEIRESIRIVASASRRCRAATTAVRIPSHAAAEGAHRRVDGGTDPPLQLFTEGFHVPRARSTRPSNRRAVSWAVTSCPTAPPSPIGCTCAPEFREPPGRVVADARGIDVDTITVILDDRSIMGRSIVSHFRIDIRQRAEEVLGLPGPASACADCCTSPRNKTATFQRRGIARSPS